MEMRRVLLAVVAVILGLSACGGSSGGAAPTAAVVSTPSLAAAAPGDNTFLFPKGICSDGVDLFVGDTQSFEIKKVTVAAGLAYTLAGTGSYGSDDGVGTLASFNEPEGVAADGGYLYVVENANHAIRKIRLSDNAVTTLAGEKEVPWDRSLATYDNAVGTSAHFTYPHGVVVVDNSLYVTDSDNHTIRKIDKNTGSVSTLAGEPGVSGSNDNAAGTSAHFNFPKGITSDGAFLYVADSDNHLIRKVNISTGGVTTLAGEAGVSGSNDNVVGTSAHFNRPFGITTDGTALYVADSENHLIRRVSIATGAVTTVAGTAGVPGTDDGTGDAARFSYPVSITLHGGKTLYVLDRDSSVIRKVSLP